MRALRLAATISNGIILVYLCSCQPYDPVTPPRLGAPVVTAVALGEARLFGYWREAVRISWDHPATDSIGVRSYTILRRTDNDSAFDVFTRSQGIPPSIDSFSDDLVPIGFPSTDFFAVRYRIFATDTLGRSSDTTEVCSLFLARQPELDTIEDSTGTFRWNSQFIQGSVETYIAVWKAESNVRYESPRREEFGSWDLPVYFSATLPDTLRPMASGRWFYAIYLFAMGTARQSLKVDSINVP